MISTHKIGLIFGKFYPLHCGHLYLIEKALSQVDELHIILGRETLRDKKLFDESRLPKQPQVSDRYSWLEQAFKHRHNIHIYVLDEANIAAYPNGWKEWSDRVKTLLDEQHIAPTTIFTSEPQDVKPHETYFNCPVKIIDAERKFMHISATQIRKSPYENWHFIAKVAQPFFVRKVAIIGGHTLQQLPVQLANIYNTAYVPNGYISYIEREFSCHNDNRYLSEADYIKIAMLHADRITKACEHANKLIFTSFDFATLTQHYQHIFKTKNDILNALQQTYHFDLVIKEQDLLTQTNTSEQFDNIIDMIESLLI